MLSSAPWNEHYKRFANSSAFLTYVALPAFPCYFLRYRLLCETAHEQLPLRSTRWGPLFAGHTWKRRTFWKNECTLSKVDIKYQLYIVQRNRFCRRSWQKAKKLFSPTDEGVLESPLLTRLLGHVATRSQRYSKVRQKSWRNYFVHFLAQVTGQMPGLQKSSKVKFGLFQYFSTSWRITGELEELQCCSKTHSIAILTPFAMVRSDLSWDQRSFCSWEQKL